MGSMRCAGADESQGEWIQELLETGSLRGSSTETGESMKRVTRLELMNCKLNEGVMLQQGSA